MAKETKIIEINVKMASALTDIAALTQKIDELTKSQKSNQKATAEDKNKYAENTVAIKEYRRQLNSLVTESANEIRAGAKKVGYLQQLEASVSNLEKAYYRLSKAELEGSKGASIVKSLREQRAELQAAQADYGKYSMNVGNYASATNMLAINVGQVMKEMPNFAISARIGIMSLTNNLPMLAEAIKAVRVQQKMMIEEGKAAPSMFSLISKSIFGLTGIMSIAMVLLQLYSGEIIRFLTNKSKAREQLEKFNKSLSDGNNFYTQAAEKLKMMEVRIGLANKGFVDGEVVLKQFNSELGSTLGNADSLNSALLLITENKKRYLTALVEMAAAQNIFTNAINLSSEALALERKGKPSFGDYIKTIGQTVEQSFNVKNWGVTAFPTMLNNIANTGSKTWENYFSKISNLNQKSSKEIADYMEEINNITKKYKDDPFFASLFGIDETTDTKDGKGLKTVPIEAIADEKITNALLLLEQRFGSLRQKYNDLVTDMVGKPIPTPQIELPSELNGESMMENLLSLADVDYAHGLTSYEEYQQTRLDILSKYLAMGMDIGEKNFEEWKELNNKEVEVKEMTEARKRRLISMYGRAAKEVVSSISEYMRAADEMELQNYSKTIAGKANYDELYAQKKYELEYESAKRQKALGVFGTIINTAEAIMSVWADKIPTPSKIILSALAGVTGALQLATISKQPLPVPPTGNVGGGIGNETTKFHTGGIAGSSPDSPTKEKEITRTLLATERVLSPQQTSIFDSLVAKVSSMGGANDIVAGAAQTQSSADVMYIAFSKAIREMPNPVMTWQEFERQQDRQKRLKSNSIIK